MILAAKTIGIAAGALLGAGLLTQKARLGGLKIITK